MGRRIITENLIEGSRLRQKWAQNDMLNALDDLEHHGNGLDQVNTLDWRLRETWVKRDLFQKCGSNSGFHDPTPPRP